MPRLRGRILPGIRFPGYGKLSGSGLEDREMGASERLDVETDKEAPADFALWKAQKPGEPAWDSPWGKGRPGWHIECSAMSMKYLGETFDIHCGGKDLLFPHHENEIAQSEGATGKPYVHYWMHNGFINVDNQKMSKSLNNFFTVRDISKEYDLEAVRLFMLSAHYRSPINFSREQIEAANASLNRLYTARDHLRFLRKTAKTGRSIEEEKHSAERLKGYENRFDAAMDDDLNTADALGAIFELMKDAKISLTGEQRREGAARRAEEPEGICGVLGFLTKEEEAIPTKIIQQCLRNARKPGRTKTGNGATSCATPSGPPDISWRIQSRGRRYARMSDNQDACGIALFLLAAVLLSPAVFLPLTDQAELTAFRGRIGDRIPDPKEFRRTVSSTQGTPEYSETFLVSGLSLPKKS